MKKVNLLICFMIPACIVYFGCSTGSKNPESNNLNSIELTIDPGDKWLGKRKVFIFSLDRTPQMAAWIENDTDNYISTIIVTNKNAKKKWLKAPKEGRLEALPVWNNRISNKSILIDSISAASSKGSVDVKIDNGSFVKGQEYTVYLEINHSFDYNEFWTEKNSGVNGQPSLIYCAKFSAGTPGKIKLDPIGYGSVDGSSGNIVSGLDGITTALAIINEANIVIN